MTVRSVVVGRRALLLEFDQASDVPAGRVAALTALSEAGVAHPEEVVPGARTLLLDGVDPIAARAAVSNLRLPSATSSRCGRLVEVPVLYDGEDLDAMAELWGIPREAVIARHSGTEFQVAFCGFAPGFPYLLGLDADVPRRASPRTRVPAGAVGLAGRFCGIYPTDSPGGWQLVGRTSARLFDVDRDPPALLPPGTRVRFVPVDELPAATPVAPDVPMISGAPPRSLTVLAAPGLCTVQDRGRAGYAHLGVPRSGAMDGPAARLANRLVGNPAGAAVIESVLSGLTLRAGSAMTVAVTGAAGPLSVSGRPADLGVPLALARDDVVTIGAATRGVYAYVAASGGLAVRPVLGSRSRDMLSGVGPEPLAAGTVLTVGPALHPPSIADFTLPPRYPDPVLLRLYPGPRTEWFGEPGLTALLQTSWTVSPSSNRIGVRLSGDPVPRLRSDELESEGMVLGGVQLPPSGEPVVLLADHPTTGGYPVIGVVDVDDLAALAQARPGTTVRFTLGEWSTT
jgi:KipI family sensor histidine kinase inhibitor